MYVPLFVHVWVWPITDVAYMSVAEFRCGLVWVWNCGSETSTSVT